MPYTCEKGEGGTLHVRVGGKEGRVYIPKENAHGSTKNPAPISNLYLRVCWNVPKNTRKREKVGETQLC